MSSRPIDYAIVNCTFIRCTEKAVCIQQEDESGVWVPRSRIHGGDDIQVENYDPGDEIAIRIESWIVEKECLKGETWYR